MKRAWWAGPVLATGTVAAALLLGYAIAPAGGALLSLLLLAVLLSAWTGGHLAGLLATALAVAGAAVLPVALRLPTPEAAPSLFVRLLVFAVVGAAMSALADRQRRQRHQLEDLRDQHKRFAEVMHSIGIGHWYSDLPTQQMHWDAQCKAHFGLPADVSVNLDLFMAGIHPEDRERFQRGAERAIFGHTSCDIDFRVMLPGGGTRWLKALGRGFYDRHGRPTRFDGITVDITRQKEAESTLADAIRMKDDFLATISHELRTPLNAVLGWARMLSSGQVPPQRVAHAISVIERNAQAQARLVEELLDLSRIESGQLRLHVEPIDAGAVLQSALEAVRPAADARGVELVTAIEPTARWVSADADRLRQVAWNLLSNAVKFTPQGGRVLVSVKPAGSALRLEVTDTGRGIAPEFLSRVFDRFSQADLPEARGVRGLGIGLAIVRELVEAHGGTVEASSPGEGLGATFTITLPGRLELPGGFGGMRRSADGTLGV
jgi:PAS domain S-box-containing protein